MAEYSVPIDDMRFVLNHIAGLGDLAGYEGFEHAQPDMVTSILEECARFVLLPYQVPVAGDHLVGLSIVHCLRDLTIVHSCFCTRIGAQSGILSSLESGSTDPANDDPMSFGGRMG